MGGFQHLHVIPIYESSTRYCPILSNLLWTYALDIGFPEKNRGWRSRADTRTNSFQTPNTGNVSFKLLTIWESQTFNGVQDAFQNVETVH